MVANHYLQAGDFDKSFKCYERGAKQNYFIGTSTFLKAFFYFFLNNFLKFLKGNEESGCEMLMMALSIQSKCSFEEYENFKTNQLIEWHLVVRDRSVN